MWHIVDAQYVVALMVLKILYLIFMYLPFDDTLSFPISILQWSLRGVDGQFESLHKDSKN